MKSLLTVMPLLFLLTSCLDFSGDFEARQNLKLVHTTIFGNEKMIDVPAGNYRAEVGFSSENKLKLELKRGNREISVKLKLPSNIDFTNARGEINIPASRTGQRYDMEGYIDSTLITSRPYRERESCNYTDYRTECQVRCDSRNNCRRVCNQVAYTRYGYRDVEYRFETIEKDIDLRFVVPRSRSIVADFQGQDSQTNKIYQYQSRCR
jgi:hypothetical protein